MTETKQCKNCGETFELPSTARRGMRFCSDRCRKASHRNYTAKSIRILKQPEVEEKWDWAKAGALATQYGRDPKWIERGLRACALAGVAPDYFIQRYLERDRSVPLHEGVNAAFIDILTGRDGT